MVVLLLTIIWILAIIGFILLIVGIIDYDAEKIGLSTICFSISVSISILGMIIY